MEKFIRNKQGENICIEILSPECSSNKIAFIGHGITSCKEEKAMEISAKTLLESGYTVINIDFRYNFGKSQRGMEKATLDSFVEDFKTVIDWAKNESFYSSPYTLVGHSMGALASTIIAQQKGEEIEQLILLTPPFEWEKAFKENRPDNYAEFEKNGFINRYNFFNPEDRDRLSINAVYSIKNHNLVQNADQITADVLVVTGDKDITAPTKYTKDFIKNLKSNHKSIEIKDCDHTFSTNESAAALSKILGDWLKGHKENINYRILQEMKYQKD